ncbi:MAG: GTP-binding protein [Prolixibacteraceae bacterium]|jgi:G3E family GTPase
MLQERIPVTIITGFLGAGKTSLLNKLIGKHPEKKFAIIENEFGETSIDGGLIKASSEAIFELNNGCICCTLGEDFLHTLENLLGSSYEFDHLLVETTGIADPTSIVDAFVSGETVQQRFKIDSIICVADAVNMEDLFQEQPEVRMQLAIADLILLNKTDCVRAGYLSELMKLVKTVNPMARLHETTFGSVENIEVLDTNSFAGEAIGKSTLTFCGMDLPVKNDSGKMSFVHNSVKPDLRHKHDISSVGFTFKGNFDVNKFGLWMQNFLYFNSENIFRVKGIMSFDQTDDQFIFHAVRSSFMFEVGSPWGNEERFSKLVFIGKKLSEKELESNLLQLLVKK